MHAIKFEYDSEGFLYPLVDYDKCVGCLRCEKVCAFKKDKKIFNFSDSNREIYAAKSKDKQVIADSSSGGMFTVLSDFFLERGDAVAACKYSYESDVVELSVFLDKKSRDESRGSKYIQAELHDSYNKLLDFLIQYPNKKMLVIGTVCQIAGLDLVLKDKKLRDRVVLVDLICHGSASSNLWKEYISKIELEQGGKLDYVTFKNKRNGWERPSTFVVINGKEVSIKPYSDWFYMSWSIRESCYECPYTRVDRNSDITIGDFWGIQKSMPDFYDSMGVSLIITHTDKGRTIFENIKENIEYRISNYDDCLQPRLISPQLRPNDRDLFWKDMRFKGMNYCIKEYIEKYEISVKEKVKYYLKKFLDMITGKK